MHARLLSGVALVVAALTVSACSSSSGQGGPGVNLPASTSGAGQRISPPTGASTSASTGGVSQVSIRFAYMFTLHAKPGPAIDIYDTVEGEAATPLVKDLGYGTVTAYLHPHLQVNSTNIFSLYALPTGEDPVAQKADAQGAGAIQDDGSHPQITMVLTGVNDTIAQGPLAELSFGERVEKGTDNGQKAPVAPAPDAGKGDFIADDSQVTNAVPGVHGTYLLIDTACDSPINGDPNQPNLPEVFAAATSPIKSSFAIFPAAPGSHTVAVSTTDISLNLTCKDLKPLPGATSFTLAAGQLVEVYVYGTSATDLHLLLAPLQP